MLCRMNNVCVSYASYLNFNMEISNLQAMLAMWDVSWMKPVATCSNLSARDIFVKDG
jgi:hypothetical protein